MIKINNKMMQYILTIDNSKVNMIEKKIDEFSKSVFSKIKRIDKAVVLDFYDKMNQLSSNSILEQYEDYTSFETSCNEMKVVDYINLEKVNESLFLLKLMEKLKGYLNENFSQYSFVIIGAINQGNISLRFHVKRQNEVDWLSDDIDGFNEALVVNTVNPIV